MFSPRRLAAVAFLFPLACQDYRFAQVCPDSVEEVELVRPAARPVPVDILFVVDDSGSMDAEQDKLADNFGRFIAEVSGDQKANYRLGVVSTDQDSPGGVARAGRAMTEYAQTFPFTWRDDLREDCAVTDVPLGCFRGPVPDLRVIDSNALDPETQIQAFKANVRVGSCGSAHEKGLLAMQDALAKMADGSCNQGFMRADANLLLVIVSDEDDDDNVQVSSYLDRLIDLKRPDQIRLAAIVGAIDGQAARCRADADNCGSLCNMSLEPSHQPCTTIADCGDGNEYCDSGLHTCESRGLDQANWANCASCSFFNTADCCSATAGGRYVDFARALEGRIVSADPSLPSTGCRGSSNGRSACLVESICQASFGDTLARIARELVDRESYALDPPTEYPDGVKVWLRGGRYGNEGRELALGTQFTVTPDGKVLHLPNPADRPMGDERLDIAYVSESGAPGEPRRGACVEP